ncbi:MAG TPA: hypothetical protein VM870_00730, partial [Pyrinomonadaceae bacterium]|nr:hypothetical protein [Pyrinomonadaceae bacterium]
MSQHPATRLSRKVVPTLVAMAALLLLSANTRPSSGEPRGGGTAAAGYEPPAVRTVLWHAGNFRYLSAMTNNLLTYTSNLQHPTAGGYGKLSSTRKANFNLLLDSLFTAIDNSLVDGA